MAKGLFILLAGNDSLAKDQSERWLRWKSFYVSITDDIRVEVIITERAIIEADKVDKIRQDS